MRHENTKIYRISFTGWTCRGIIGGILGNFDGFGIENLTFATYNNVVVISIVATIIIILVEAIVLMNQRRALKYKRLVDEEVDIDATDQYELLANRYVLNGSILSIIQTIIAFVVLLIFVVGQAEANGILFFLIPFLLVLFSIHNLHCLIEDLMIECQKLLIRITLKSDWKYWMKVNAI